MCTLLPIVCVCVCVSYVALTCQQQASASLRQPNRFQTVNDTRTGHQVSVSDVRPVCAHIYTHTHTRTHMTIGYWLRSNVLCLAHSAQRNNL